MTDPVGTFAKWAPIYRQRGLSPRPITRGTKKCPVKGWQKPDDQFAPGEFERWLVRYADFGIGPSMGSPFPDGAADYGTPQTRRRTIIIGWRNVAEPVFPTAYECGCSTKLATAVRSIWSPLAPCGQASPSLPRGIL